MHANYEITPCVGLGLALLIIVLVLLELHYITVVKSANFKTDRFSPILANIKSHYISHVMSVVSVLAKQLHTQKSYHYADTQSSSRRTKKFRQASKVTSYDYVCHFQVTSQYAHQPVSSYVISLTSTGSGLLFCLPRRHSNDSSQCDAINSQSSQTIPRPKIITFKICVARFSLCLCCFRFRSKTVKMSRQITPI